MAMSSHKLGPGTLTMGSTGSAQEFGAALKGATLKPDATDGDEIFVLDGSSLIDGGEETWVLEGVVYQSYDMESLIVWCSANTGEEMEFTYRANNAQALQATGTLVVRAIAYGGDVRERNTSDFKFQVKGNPVFVDGDA